MSGEARPGDLEVPQGAEICLIIVDEQTLVREALGALIEGQPGLSVAGLARSATNLTASADPDVVITELRITAGGDDQVAELRQRFPRSGILVLTTLSHPARVQAALAAGADGYLLKSATPSDLMLGIRAVARGDSYLQPSLGVALARWHGPRSEQELSPAEERVLMLLATGHTNSDMAAQLGVSTRTVETHRSRVQQKLRRNTRAELFSYALASGLLDGF